MVIHPYEAVCSPTPDDSDVQHYLTYLTLEGRLYISPAGRDRPIRTCLDAGTGTGSWALEFGQPYHQPQACPLRD
jgi:hypothetical protein